MHSIEYLRKLHGIKKGELASFIGCPRQQLYDWVSGRRPIPEKYVRNLCKFFNLPEDKSYILKIKNISEEDKRNLDKLHKKTKEYTFNPDELKKELEIERKSSAFRIAKEKIKNTEKEIELIKKHLNIAGYDSFDKELNEIKLRVNNLFEKVSNIKPDSK
mgnify:FL=1